MGRVELKVWKFRTFTTLIRRQVRNVGHGDQPAECYMPGVVWVEGGCGGVAQIYPADVERSPQAGDARCCWRRRRCRVLTCRLAPPLDVTVGACGIPALYSLARPERDPTSPFASSWGEAQPGSATADFRRRSAPSRDVDVTLMEPPFSPF